MSKKLGETAKVTAGIAPGIFAAGDLTPIVIDRYAFEDAIVHLKVGAATGTPTAQSVALKLQTGDAVNGSDMSDVTGEVITALTADNLEAELDLDLAGYKRYLQVIPTVAFTAGTTPKIPVAVTVVLGKAVSIPV